MSEKLFNIMIKEDDGREKRMNENCKKKSLKIESINRIAYENYIKQKWKSKKKEAKEHCVIKKRTVETEGLVCKTAEGSHLSTLTTQTIEFNEIISNIVI